MSAPIVDALVTVGPSLFGDGLAVDDIEQVMRRADITHAVLVPARPPAYLLDEGNDLVAEIAARDPAAFVGLARIDPNRSDAGVDALERALAKGLRGLYLHPQQEVFQITDSRVDALIDRCSSQGLPVVVATGYPWMSEALQVAELARRHSDATFVMTNGGQFNISGLGQFDAELALAANENILIQTAGVYRQDFIERTVERFGAGRVMFASATPAFDCSYEILRVRLSRLAVADREAVLGGTARRVFGIANDAAGG